MVLGGDQLRAPDAEVAVKAIPALAPCSLARHGRGQPAVAATYVQWTAPDAQGP